MEELNQVLERMRNTFEERGWNSSTSPTPQLGLTNPGGNLTTLQNQNPVAVAPSPFNQNQAGLPKETASPPNISLKANERAELAKTLARVCALQRRYGQTQAELETLVEGFAWAIEVSGMPFDLWIRGIAKHILVNTEIPRPADILNIINPPPKPKEKLSAAMYVNIMKQVQNGKFLWGDDKKFIEAYQAQEMSKIGESEELREANKELEFHRLAIEHHE